MVILRSSMSALIRLCRSSASWRSATEAGVSCALNQGAIEEKLTRKAKNKIFRFIGSKLGTAKGEEKSKIFQRGRPSSVRSAMFIAPGAQRAQSPEERAWTKDLPRSALRPRAQHRTK